VKGKPEMRARLTKAKHKKASVGIVSVLVIAAAAISVASASTTTINPAGDTLIATSTNPSFTVASGPKISCPFAQTDGVNPNPAATVMAVHSMQFEKSASAKECAFSWNGEQFNVLAEGAWELSTNSPSSANLVLPNEYSLQINAAVKNCHLRLAEPTTISGVWSSGEGRFPEEKPLALGKPSVLTFASAVLPVKKSGKPEEVCPGPLNEAKSLSFSAAFIVNDTTNLGSNISLK
jgi:hypothetical protein